MEDSFWNKVVEFLFFSGIERSNLYILYIVITNELSSREYKVVELRIFGWSQKKNLIKSASIIYLFFHIQKN